MIVELKRPQQDYVHCAFCDDRTKSDKGPIIEFGSERSNRVVVGICPDCLRELVKKSKSLGIKL